LSGRFQIAGKSAIATGVGPDGWIRLIDLSFDLPVTGLLIVTGPGAPQLWQTRIIMGGSFGGPTVIETWNDATRVALSWAGQQVTLDVRAPAGQVIAAAAGLAGAAPDLASGFGHGQVLVDAVTTQALDALRANGDVQPVRQDDAGKLLSMPYGIRQFRVQGDVNQNAFAAGGTAVVIAAPGAGLANNLTSVQIGLLTATSIITLESPAGTVLFAASVGVIGYPPFSMPVPLVGGSNADWIVRSSAISTFSVNAQGFTERVA
jgi:hypothetical protein